MEQAGLSHISESPTIAASVAAGQRSPATRMDRRGGLRRVTHFLRLRCDAAEFAKQDFVQRAARAVSPGVRVLDAGAGECPHRALFSHARYESCDIIPAKTCQHTYLCDVKDVPVADGTYDAILSVHVLDDVPDPQAVINEMHRVLRLGGSLFLTAPLSGRVHNEPYHFFQFTRYGLELLFKKAGFEIVKIEECGGVFWYLNYMSRKLPRYLYRQYRLTAQPGSGIGRRAVVAMGNGLLTLGYLISLPIFAGLLPFGFFYLDALDRQRAFTLGYACRCIKRRDASVEKHG